jgi:hypothetical protein
MVAASNHSLCTAASKYGEPSFELLLARLMRPDFALRRIDVSNSVLAQTRFFLLQMHSGPVFQHWDVAYV